MTERILAVNGRKVRLQRVANNRVAETASSLAFFDYERSPAPCEIEQIAETAIEHGRCVLGIVLADWPGMIVECDFVASVDAIGTGQGCE